MNDIKMTMKRKNQSVISGSLLIHLGQLAMMQ